MTTVLRLDPAYPTLWRGPSSLQFGIEPVAVVDDPTPWQQRLLTELDRGIPDTALLDLADAFGVPDREVRDFVAALDRVLLARDAVGAPPLAVAVRADRDVDRDVREAIRQSLQSAGITPHDVPADEQPQPRLPVLLIAQHIVEPRSAAAMTRDDIHHLPLVFSGGQATIGPYVQPGVTACLACAHAYRRDADPDWPMLAAQLIGRRVATVPVSLAAEAGGLAARLMRAGATAPDQPQRSVTLSAASARRVWTTHRPHAECGCRSLQGNERDSAPTAPGRATTTATAFAPHA